MFWEGALTKRYNVVFIMTDQQRWDMLGCYGSAWMHTPNLDRLAASGCRFNAAYTTSPVCTPARAGLFTGMYPSSSGAAANQLSPHRHVEFLGDVLTRGGVAAGYVGKWHLCGPQGKYYGDGRCEGGFLPEYWYDGKNFIDDVGQDGFARWRAGRGLAESDCWGGRVADRAVRFLAERHKQPFVLVVSLDEPHGPCSAPEHFYKLYEGTTRPWQANMADNLEGKPATQRAFLVGHPGGQVPPGQDLNNSPRYYGTASFADHQIGRIIDAVDELCGDDTAVIFTTDHGDHQGAHGLLGKGPTMYEEVIRVPLLVRAPGLTRPGSVCDSLVSHIHLAPTICALAGVQRHPQFQGADAVPLLADPAAKITDAVFLEYNRFGLPHTHWWGCMPIRCIRTESRKLAVNLLDFDELYDLSDDGGEMVNRIHEPAMAEMRDRLHDRLLTWQEERLDPFRGQGWWARPWRPGHSLDPRPPAAH